MTPAPTVTSAPTPCRDDSAKCSDSGWDCCAREIWGEEQTCFDGYVAVPSPPGQCQSRSWCEDEGCYACYPPACAGPTLDPSQAPTLTADRRRLQLRPRRRSRAPTFTAEPTSCADRRLPLSLRLLRLRQLLRLRRRLRLRPRVRQRLLGLCCATTMNPNMKIYLYPNFTSASVIASSARSTSYGTGTIAARRATPIAAGAATWTGTAKGTSGRKRRLAALGPGDSRVRGRQQRHHQPASERVVCVGCIRIRCQT